MYIFTFTVLFFVCASLVSVQTCDVISKERSPSLIARAVPADARHVLERQIENVCLSRETQEVGDLKNLLHGEHMKIAGGELDPVYRVYQPYDNIRVLVKILRSGRRRKSFYAIHHFIREGMLIKWGSEVGIHGDQYYIVLRDNAYHSEGEIVAMHGPEFRVTLQGFREVSRHRPSLFDLGCQGEDYVYCFDLQHDLTAVWVGYPREPFLTM